jgi:hypothetical protein
MSHTEPGVLGTSLATDERVFMTFPDNPSVAEILSGNNNTTCLLHFWKRLKMMAPHYSNDYLGVGPLFISNTQNILNSFFYSNISGSFIFWTQTKA